jgi:dTDP-4-dehydrorhamnose 3,5-epimerase
MKFIKAPLDNVILIEPTIFGDSRGFFLESFREQLFYEAGIKEKFVQENYSRSTKGVLRGLHYQLVQPQGKLVRVTRGEVFDVAVDIRLGSPSFGDWFGVTLNDVTMRMMYIPPGFAHGFVVLSDTADFSYKCTEYYHPDSEQGILWNDPRIGIKWPITDISLSGKDRDNPVLSEETSALLPTY